MKIEIELPDEIAKHHESLSYFLKSMILKLHINRHKDNNDYNVTDAMDGLESEFNELIYAVKKEGQFEAFMEAVDVANMAWLVGREAIYPNKDKWKKIQSELHDGASIADVLHDKNFLKAE